MISVNESDLEVMEQEYLAQSSTVLMIDISHSMILYGEDRITPAKKVAMALSELIMTQISERYIGCDRFWKQCVADTVKIPIPAGRALSHEHLCRF